MSTWNRVGPDADFESRPMTRVEHKKEIDKLPPQTKRFFAWWGLGVVIAGSCGVLGLAGLLEYGLTVMGKDLPEPTPGDMLFGSLTMLAIMAAGFGVTIKADWLARKTRSKNG